MPAARVGGTDGIISATCTISGGSATLGSDYILLNQGPITWTAGSTASQWCGIGPINDNLAEGDETIILAITGDVSAPSVATITIVDDDGGNAIVGFSSPGYSTGQTESADLQLERTGNLGTSFTVSYSYFSEVEPSKVIGPLVMSWAAGEALKRITIPAIGGNSPGYERPVTVVLSNPSATAVLGGFSRTTIRFPGTGALNLTPSVRILTPNIGPAAGGTTVNINGYNLTGATAVSFGGAPCAITGRFADVSLTCVTSAHVGGSVDVIVTTPNGVSSPTGPADDFEYVGTLPATPTPASPTPGSPVPPTPQGSGPTPFPATSTPSSATATPVTKRDTPLPYRLASLTVASDGWY